MRGLGIGPLAPGDHEGPPIIRVARHDRALRPTGGALLPMNERRQRVTQRLRQVDGAAGFPVDIDMDEPALRGRRRLVIRKQSDLVDHRAAAQALDQEPRRDAIGELQGLEIAAAVLHNQPDDMTLMDVEDPLIDQVLVHHRIEVGEVDDIVDVTVDVVVGPAGCDRLQVRIDTAPDGIGCFDGLYP
jgi:hypothetical protein